MEINICDFIRERVDEMDLNSMVRFEIQNLISDNAKTFIENIIDGEAKRLVTEEIQKIMDNPVKTDDGWGKKESFQSFEDLFKSVFKQKIKDSYHVEREIKKHIESRLDSLIKGRMDEVIEKIVDNLTCNKLVKK